MANRQNLESSRSRAKASFGDGGGVLPELTSRYPPTLDSPGRARSWVLGYLEAEFGDGGRTDDALLMVSELVTNAVQHARTVVTVQVRIDGRSLEIAVTDTAPLGTPLPHRPDLGADGPSTLTERGRGLAIVDTLADSWGVTATATGKRIWFRLAMPALAPSPTET